MELISAHPQSVRFRTGERIAFLPNDTIGLFFAVLGAVLARDWRSPARLASWDAVCLECDRELCFIAGQLRTQSPMADELRDAFCCWVDELRSTLGPTPERPKPV